MATTHQYTTTRLTTVKHETVRPHPAATRTKPVDVRAKAHVEIIGNLDMVLIDGLVPRELALHIVATVNLYRAGTLTLG